MSLQQFTQTPDSIELVLQFPSGSISKANLHVDVTPIYLKLNAPPNLIEFDLTHEIDIQHIQTLINKNIVTIKAKKVVAQEWSSLTINPPGTKESSAEKAARLQRRKQSLAAMEELNQSLQAQKAAEAKARAKSSLESHWELDKRKHELVHQIENEQRVVTEKELKAWSKSLPEKQASSTASTPTVEQISEPTSQPQASSIPELEDADEAASDVKSNKNIWNADEIEEAKPLPSTSSSSTSSQSTSRPPAPSVPLPPVRRGGKVEISFTPEATPMPSMPARESMMAQKMAYKATQGLTSSTTAADPAKQDLPIFLKEKGDRLFKDGDTTGAITAYTNAIERATKLAMNGVAAAAEPLLMARCYSNRSAAHLKLASLKTEAAIAQSRAQLRKCIQDCTTTFTILSNNKPPPLTLESMNSYEYDLLRLKNLQRRSTCYAWLGTYQLAMEDLNELLEQYPRVETTHKKLQQWATEEEKSEQKESEVNSEEKVIPNITPLPAFDLDKLREDVALFSKLILAFEQHQAEAFKAEGDQFLSSTSSGASTDHVVKAIASYTQALLIQPSSFTILSNRLVAKLQLGQWQDVIQDSLLAASLWEESWLIPRTGLNAVAPAPPSTPITLTPKSTSVTVTPKPPSVEAILQRIKFLLRRGTARVGLNQLTQAQTDLQQAAALAPLTAQPALLTSIQRDLDFLTHHLSLGRLRTKASLAMKDAKYLTAIDLFTKAIEQHNRVSEVGCSLEAVKTQGWYQRIVAASTSFSSSTPPPPPFSVRTHHVSDLCALLSDRAAAHLSLRQYAETIKDTKVALQLWSTQLTDQFGSSSSSTSSQPQPAWYLPTLIRLGSSYAFVGEWNESIRIYELALSQWANAPKINSSGGMSIGETTTQPAASVDEETERMKVQHDLGRIREASGRTRTSIASTQP